MVISCHCNYDGLLIYSNMMSFINMSYFISIYARKVIHVLRLFINRRLIRRLLIALTLKIYDPKWHRFVSSSGLIECSYLGRSLSFWVVVL
jgi:hypothetical protein